jgi:hypothetical protein
MINLSKLCDLNVYAASGLVKKRESFFVVSDDETTLLQFQVNGPMVTLPLIPGDLPESKAERKRAKPDFECLCTDGIEIYALPSCSTQARYRAVRVDDQWSFTLAPLAQELLKQFPELNIEGAAFVDDELWLLQRGNGALGMNAVIRLDRTRFLEGAREGAVHPDAIKHINLVELGKFGFTDACFANGSVYFLAVAEASESTYEDGAFLGAVLGRMNLSGKIVEQDDLDCNFKPEGLWVEDDQIFVVTDADDRTIKSALMTGKLEGKGSRTT